MVDSLIFCDENKIPDFTSNIFHSNFKIISFDIHSHNLLDAKKIDHTLIEDYLENDKKIINNLSIKLSQNWYKQDLAQEFVYEDMNLGSMIEFELNLFFLKQLKKIIGIKNILDKEKPKNIIANSSLLNICSFFNFINNLSKSKLPIVSKNNTSYDKVALPINIGSKSINFWLPRSTATKIARIFEFILNNTFNVKFNESNKQDETILLLDLTPKPYDTFLNALSVKFSNVLLLNDEVTTSWNIKNLSIIKNSKSKVSSLYKFNTKETKKKIVEIQFKIDKNLENLLNNENFEFFSYDDVNFWNLIKHEFIHICKINFHKAIHVIESSLCFFSNVNIKNVVTLYQNVYQLSVLYVAKKYGIPAIRLQHGLDPLTDSWSKYLKLDRQKQQDNLSYAVWSIYEKRYLFDYEEINDKKIAVIGNPRYDKLFNIPKIHNDNTLLLASSFTWSPWNLSNYDTNISEEHKLFFKESCQILNDIKNKKLIIKLHPGAIPTYDVQKIINEINPLIPVYKTQYIIDLLQNCEVLINMGFSTILLESMILGKPTITIMTNPDLYQDDVIIKNKITQPVYTPLELKSAINSILFDKKFKENQIQKGKEFVQSYLANPGNASNSFVKYIKGI